MKRILTMLLLLACMHAKAQENNKLQKIVTTLDSFRGKIPVEKVHVHLDKPYYTLGDTIWLKAYVVDGTNGLSSISKIVYADLIDDKDSVKMSLRLPITAGLAWGTITLTDSLLKAGSYHLRAYTTLMRNFGNDYFFNKSIRIGDALPPIVNNNIPFTKNKPPVNKPAPIASVKSAEETVSIQFFPEGGDLINGDLTKTAFKAIGADGLSREVSGYIIDQANNQVVTFQSAHAGMGNFMLQPVAGNSYTAVVKAGNTGQRVALPKALNSGYSLSVNQDDENIRIKIIASKSLLQTGTITLIAQASDEVKYTGKKELNNTTYTTVIPKSRFPEGIVQITLFDPDYKPVAERLVFVRKNNNHLKINFTADKTGYTPRDKVHLDLQVTDEQGKPAAGVFSMAVTDEGKVPYDEADETTIFSSLLLAADLKGYIEKPNYYFTDTSAAKAQQLDNLLLTQGWRRFLWKDILSNKLPPLAYQAETGGGISGTVFRGKNKPAANAKVSLFINTGNGLILDTLTDARGRFNFDNLPFARDVKFNITATDAKGGKNVTVEQDKPQNFEPPTVDHLPAEQPKSNDLTTYLASSRQRFDEMQKNGLLNRGHVLQEVVINDFYKKTATVRAIATQHSQNLAGPGNADQVLTFVDLLPCASTGHLELCLQGRLTNINIVRKFPSGWAAYSRNFSKPMAVFVDGIKRDDYYNVSSYDIASIEILRGGGAAALYGFDGDSGVIIITTKKGDVNYDAYIDDFLYPGLKNSRGLKSYNFQNGYDMRRQFYSPNYSNPVIDKQQADLRTTIYWNPNVITDENGKASVEFFNADGKGKYRVITEGLSPVGQLGRETYRYIVK